MTPVSRDPADGESDIPWGGMALTDRQSMASWLDTAGILALGPTSAPEHVEAALIRVRELLSAVRLRRN